MPQVYSTQLVGTKQSVVDELLLLNPHMTPLINLVGFGQPVTNTQHTWFEDEMYAFESTVAGAKTASDTSITVADAEPFRVGHVVKIGDELLLVTAVNSGTKTLTVTRGYGGTTAAAIADQAKIEVLFTEGDEGLNARDARYKPRKAVTNYTQIFDDTVSLSGTAIAIAQWGVDDEYDKERIKKQIELALQLEKALINGIGLNNGTKRMMKGIRQFVQTNVVDATSQAISHDMINNALQKIYKKGGFQSGADYKIMVGAKQKRAIAMLDSALVRLTRDDNGRGQKADFYVSDFGTVEIVLNNNIADNELYIVDRNRMAIRPLQNREFSHEYLGKVGDRMEGIIVGEYTLEFRQEAAHARIKNLA